MSHRELTSKQQRYVEEYLLDPSARQAAIRAGYSPQSARWHGHVLRRKPAIDAAIRQAQDRRAEEIGVASEDVLRELASIAFAPVVDGGPMKYRDKLRALELLGRHLGMFEPHAGSADPDMARRVEIVIVSGHDGEDLSAAVNSEALTSRAKPVRSSR